jgi:hypothetical protein
VLDPHMDAVIHNAVVYSGPDAMPVNTVTPYLLTALIDHPERLSPSAGASRSRRARRRDYPALPKPWGISR